MDRMYALFPRLGERRKQAAGTMSGGERQMVAMAKALMPEPPCFSWTSRRPALPPLSSTPSSRRSPRSTQEGVTILMVEQNARARSPCPIAATSSTWARSASNGPGKELIADPKVAELYLGGGSRVDDTKDASAVVGDAGL